MKNTIIKFAGLNALGATLYIVLVASFLFYGPQFFATKTEDTVFIPIAMLLLFVLSASVTGLLVLGRPVFWYLDGKKKEAVSLLMTTIGFLSIITVIAFVVMMLMAR